ncbi:MAG TPA: CoA transferase, partial [Alphaproteobacteria bacterium]|nr:CoA transferase [Alphaproteobacteria bacterium]
RPRLVRTILPDKLAAVTASQAIAAALFARARTGEGQHVKLSMLDATLAFLWASDMGGQTYVGRSVTNQTAASFIDLIYETKDGHMTVAVMSDKEWLGLTRALEKPEWLADPRFQTPALRDENVDARLALTQEVLKERTTAEWMERLEQEGVPCAPALTRNQVIDHPQVLASDILVELDHPVAGRLRQARPAARFDATPSALTRGAPELGEHTDEVLAEIGCSATEIERLRADGVIGSERPVSATPGAAE